MEETLSCRLITKISRPVVQSSGLCSGPQSPGCTRIHTLAGMGKSTFGDFCLFYGTEEQFCRSSRDILNRVFREAIPYGDLNTTYDQKQKDAIREILLQFCGTSPDQVVLLWVTPVWPLMTNNLPVGTRIIDRSAKPSRLGRHKYGMQSVSLSYGLCRTDLSIPLGQIQFYYPVKERGRNPVLVRHFRWRTAMLNGKTLYKEIREEAIMLARPGSAADDYWLDRAKVPTEESLWRERDSNGPRRVEYATVTFAKLCPDISGQCATAHQITFSLTYDGKIAGLRGSRRPFQVFLAHHHGLEQAILSLV